MRLLTITIAFICSSLICFAQQPISEGKVIYHISYENRDSAEIANLPSETIVYFTKNFLRMEMKTNTGYDPVTLIDTKAKTSTTLLEVAGKKFAIVNEKADKQAKKEVKKKKPVVYNTETKTIAGFLCKRADVQLKNNKSYTIYYTEDIASRNASINSPLYEIKGFLMEYWVSSGKDVIKMSAQEVIQMDTDDKLFDIPSDYEITSREKFRELFGSR